MSPSQILFVDDEEDLRIIATQTFELADLAVSSFSSAKDVLPLIGTSFDGVLVSDIRMPGMDGVALLEKVQKVDPEIPVILVTGHGDVELAVSCIKSGAYDFVEKPWRPERLVTCVTHAAAQRRLVLENRELQARVLSGESLSNQLTGRSAIMETLRKTVRTVGATDVDVLITGDTGTGKEVAARLLHSESARSKGPFIHINCAALPEALIENELFGHEAGAFPGATRTRFGKLEHARGGTLCLDEIDLLPVPLQAKLLDVLHNRTLTRLGSNDPVALDMRVVALTKTDLEEAVAAKQFRADLLYRLNVATIEIPPLRARTEDIPSLFIRLASDVAQTNGCAMPDVPADLLASLTAQSWPGNVRELRNAAERFVLGLSGVTGPELAPTLPLAKRVASYEKAQIAATIAAHGGRLKETYKTLGLSRKALYDKMQRHGLNRSDFAEDDR